ncbi:hypothetical protein B8V81_3275 [Paenibacillus pasadenensis]|uniref:Uncharacterized protein n=1 Tax=Paenibacillus pasadenensis TaxID=217090 RepID=A0A2N5N3C3_9BACL|nr:MULTISPECIES: hypothetical protein [Paenibacillus]PLT44844.1 hypothetical protein B8V81_3275 [Paenibacillus pasadenensis]QGG55305.1 hypothetical protein GE073_06725 [Paenibacillus sp. B01]
MSRNRKKASAKQGASPRQHELDSTRKLWPRKPQTQVGPSRKQQERRTWCRKGRDDGAFPVRAGRPA